MSYTVIIKEKNKAVLGVLLQLGLPAGGGLSLNGVYMFTSFPSFLSFIHPLSFFLPSLEPWLLLLCVYCIIAQQSSPSLSISYSTGSVSLGAWGVSDRLVLQLSRHEITPAAPAGS